MKHHKERRQRRDEDEEGRNPTEREQKKRKNYLGKDAGNALEKVSYLCPPASLSYTRMNMCDMHLTWDGTVTPIFFPCLCWCYVKKQLRGALLVWGKAKCHARESSFPSFPLDMFFRLLRC
jgi:hypothetical protein